MKQYSNGILSMKVSGCRECPHRHGKRYKSGGKFYTEQVCFAATIKVYDDTLERETERNTYPSVKEQVMYGGFLPECPLPDYEY
ncbi:MAG: hypothetical protein PHC50_04505 [Candidatus Cloacimonetes bacterium]|nr:hypothetical protein [Candidatus Cloacimonadota bacterium]